MCKIKLLFYGVFWKSSSPSTVHGQQGTLGKVSNISGSGQGSLTSLELEPYTLDADPRNHCKVNLKSL